jgi:hypothetical protein
MQLKSGNRVDHAGDGSQCPCISAQVVRDGIPPAQQEIRRADEERESQEPEGDVPRCRSSPCHEHPVLHPVIAQVHWHSSGLGWEMVVTAWAVVPV